MEKFTGDADSWLAVHYNRFGQAYWRGACEHPFRACRLTGAVKIRFTWYYIEREEARMALERLRTTIALECADALVVNDFTGAMC